MPVLSLPENPSLENLRKRAKRLRDAVGQGEASALAEVRELHPRGEHALADFSLSDALLVVARGYGFPSWPKLKAHLDVVERYGFVPPPPSAGSAPADFVRHVCLSYGDWHPRQVREGERMLEENPGLAREDVFAAAAAGDVAAVRAWLERDPALVRARGGPFGWEPLLYACYSRIPSTGGRSTLEVARTLLTHGADPNAGFLWAGNVPPFTALTGAFGEGEGGAAQPPHPDRDALARLLLDAGADPNDGQTLYNRHFRSDDGHLEMLFRYGLGTDRGGPWYARLGQKLASPARLLVEELWAAARRNFFARVRLLVEHGADVDTPGLRDGRTAWETAMLQGNREIADYLAAHEAKRTELGGADAFAAACVAGRREEALALLKKDPGLLEKLGRAGRIRLIHRAVEAERLEGIRLMSELGFELDGKTEHDRAGADLSVSALHNAAWMGSLPMVRLLVELGAEPDAKDPHHGATPLGWAEYNGQDAVAKYLRTVTAPAGSS